MSMEAWCISWVVVAAVIDPITSLGRSISDMSSLIENRPLGNSCKNCKTRVRLQLTSMGSAARYIDL